MGGVLMPEGTATLPPEKVRQEPRPPLERRKWRAGGGGALAGGIVAAVAGILALAGLAGVYPASFLSLAVLGVGVSFLLEGVAVMVSFTSRTPWRGMGAVKRSWNVPRFFCRHKSRMVRGP